MALWSPVCAGTGSAAGGVDAEGPKQWDQRSPEEPAEIHKYIFFVLVLLPALLGIVFVVVSFPAVRSLSWLPLISRLLL